MIIYLQFVGRKPGFPSSDFLIINKQLIQTSAAWYVDVDQAARDGIDVVSRRGGERRPRRCKLARSREMATAL